MGITVLEKGSDYILNHFRVKWLREGFLLTTDFGSWAFLSKEEYNSLINGSFTENPGLFFLLEKKGLILTSENIDYIGESYRQRHGFMCSGVRMHIIILKNNDELMKLATAKKTVEFIFQSPSENIEIEFKDDLVSSFDLIKFIVEYSKSLSLKSKKKTSFRIVSDMKGMDEEKFGFLIKENFSVNSYLDGPRWLHEKNNEFISGNSYDSVIKWSEKFNSRFRINLSPRITKFSLEYTKEIIDSYVNLNLNGISLMPLHISNYTDNWPRIGYSPEEFVNFWKTSIDYIISLNKKRLFYERFGVLFLRNIITREGSSHKDFTNPNGSIVRYLAYGHDGSVYPSDESIGFDIFKLGNVGQKYTDVVVSPQSIALIRASINDSQYSDINVYFPYLSLCNVCSYAENSNIIPKLPDFRFKTQNSILEYLFEKLIFDKDQRKILLSWIN